MLRLAPATDFSSDLPDLLLVIAGDLDRRVIRGLDLDPFGDRKVDIMAVAKLQLQITTLSIRTLADDSDFQNLGEAFGNARNQVLHQSAMLAPLGPCSLGRFCRLNQNITFM